MTKTERLDGKLEPEAKGVTTSVSDAALISIAVSLKRIADVLTEQTIRTVRTPGAHYEPTDEDRYGWGGQG